MSEEFKHDSGLTFKKDNKVYLCVNGKVVSEINHGDDITVENMTTEGMELFNSVSIEKHFEVDDEN